MTLFNGVGPGISYFYPPANLSTFFNEFWKGKIMDDTEKCSNLPIFNRWEPPFKRKYYLFSRCFLTTNDFRMKSPERSQKFEINLKKGKELISRVILYLEGVRYYLGVNGYYIFY